MNDECFGGVVVSIPLEMDDGNPCTFDHCDPGMGVVHDSAPYGHVVENSITCGVGACVVDGMLICNGAGSTISDCEPFLPTEEVCDGLDKDCDGVIDNNISSIVRLVEWGRA
jgi:hypothetical protein